MGGGIRTLEFLVSYAPGFGMICFGSHVRLELYSKSFQEFHCGIYTWRYTYTRLTALCPGLPGWAGTRKVEPIWILLKREAVSGSGISWAVCKSAPRSRQITTPAPHQLVFLQAGCPSCRPTNSVKALKGLILDDIRGISLTANPGPVTPQHNNNKM